MSVKVIAIDGPAASGKSTAAARVAAYFSIPYVNTGNLFRAVALAALRRYGNRLGELSELDWHELLSFLKLEYRRRRDGSYDLRMGGHYPGKELRRPAVTAVVSLVAAIPKVRAFILKTERGFAETGWVVMEGRDIGTVVFPDAGYKFFVTASPLERARRRLAQEGEVAAGATLESVAAEIEERDRLDSTREIAPLIAAPDATVIDTTDMDLEAAAQAIIERIHPDELA